MLTGHVMGTLGVLEGARSPIGSVRCDWHAIGTRSAPKGVAGHSTGARGYLRVPRSTQGYQCGGTAWPVAVLGVHRRGANKRRRCSDEDANVFVPQPRPRLPRPRQRRRLRRRRWCRRRRRRRRWCRPRSSRRVRTAQAHCFTCVPSLMQPPQPPPPHTQKHTPTQTHANTYPDIHARTQTRTHAHTHTRTHTHTRARAGGTRVVLRGTRVVLRVGTMGTMGTRGVL